MAAQAAQTQRNDEAEVKKSGYRYGVRIYNNKINIYYKDCDSYGYCNIGGSILRLDENILEEYEVSTKRREGYKTLGIIAVSDHEAQQIKAYAEQMLKLYDEEKYDDMLKTYSAAVEYIDNIIRNYVSTLKNAYSNLYSAIIELANARKNKEREQYNLNIQVTPMKAKMLVYNYKYGVTIYEDRMYISRTERPMPGYGNSKSHEIAITFNTGVARAIETRSNWFGTGQEYEGIVWLREDEVITLKNYAEQLVNYIEEYNYNAAADILNKAAKYVRGLIV